MDSSRRRALAGLLALGATIGGREAAAQAQAWPARPVKILVPLAPGGSTDLIARVVGNELSKVWSVPVIVENRVGAGGVIGLQALAAAPPDGYTLMLGNVSTNALNQTIYADKMSFKPDEALVPVTMVATISSILIAAPQQKAKSFREFVAEAKANPGKFNYASTGIGSYSAIDNALLMKRAGIEVTHVPYPAGGSALVLPVANNDAQIAFLSTPVAMELVKGGRVQAWAVTSARRNPQLPQVPTMAEIGFAGVGTDAWQGIFAPAGTPPEMLQKIHAGFQAAVATPAVQAQFEKNTITPAISPSVDEFKKFVTQEIVHWRDLVNELGVKMS